MLAGRESYKLVGEGTINEDMKQNEQEKQLWRRYSALTRNKGQLPELDPNLLAAYVEGRADREEVEQVEAQMASDPVLLKEVTELREVLGMEAGSIPVLLLAKAKALAPVGAKPKAWSRSDIRASKSAWWRHIQAGAAAAVVVLACLGGFSVGRVTVRGHLQAQAAVSSGVSHELEELMAGPALGIILQNNGRNGGE